MTTAQSGSISDDVLATLPAGLAALPVDPRRKLPIPVVNTYPAAEEGGAPTWDFTAINGDVSLELSRAHCCGLCGQPLGYWIAFLGGPRSVESRAYSDPPMHVECAEASLRLCPHIARPRMKRAKDDRVPIAAITPEGMSLERPASWVLYVTRSFEIELRRNADGSGFALYRPAAPKTLRTFGYDEGGVLVEAPKRR